MNFRINATAARAIAAGLVAAATVLSAPADSMAADGVCLGGCKQRMRECVLTDARPSNKACRIGCKENRVRGERGACFSACNLDQHAVTDQCRTDRGDCRRICRRADVAPDVSGSCVRGCGAALSDCASSVLATSRICLQGCRELPRHERRGCVDGCVTTSRAGAGSCRLAFDVCLGGC